MSEAEGLPAAKADLLFVDCPRCGLDKPRFRYKLQRSNIVTCTSCGFSYVNPRVSSEWIYYKLQQWAHKDVVDDVRLQQAFSAETQDYYSRFLQRVEPHVSPGERRLLDIGCGTGQFLMVARDCNWQCHGLEIGTASATYATNELGLDVQQGSLYDTVLDSETYSLISIIEVIEHLENPVQALQVIHNALMTDGLLLLTTPNFNCLFRRLFGPGWWVVNCEDEHIMMFDLESLTGILEENGFDVVNSSIQGLDPIGMIRQWRKGRGRGTNIDPVSATLAQSSAGMTNCGSGGEKPQAGYYEARSELSRVKSVLNKLHLANLARGSLRLLSRSYGYRWSPTYAWGEQLVVVARKKS